MSAREQECAAALSRRARGAVGTACCPTLGSGAAARLCGAAHESRRAQCSALHAAGLGNSGRRSGAVMIHARRALRLAAAPDPEVTMQVVRPNRSAREPDLFRVKIDRMPRGWTRWEVAERCGACRGASGPRWSAARLQARCREGVRKGRACVAELCLRCNDCDGERARNATAHDNLGLTVLHSRTVTCRLRAANRSNPEKTTQRAGATRFSRSTGFSLAGMRIHDSLP
jgi:hypothetical protein